MKNDATHYLKLAEEYTEKHQYPEAIAVLNFLWNQRIILKFTDNGKFFFLLGFCCQSLGDFKSAINNYYAISDWRFRPEVLDQLSHCYAALGDQYQLEKMGLRHKGMQIHFFRSLEAKREAQRLEVYAEINRCLMVPNWQSNLDILSKLIEHFSAVKEYQEAAKIFQRKKNVLFYRQAEQHQKAGLHEDALISYTSIFRWQDNLGICEKIFKLGMHTELSEDILTTLLHKADYYQKHAYLKEAKMLYQGLLNYRSRDLKDHSVKVETLNELMKYAVPAKLQAWTALWKDAENKTKNLSLVKLDDSQIDISSSLKLG